MFTISSSLFLLLRQHWVFLLTAQYCPELWISYKPIQSTRYLYRVLWMAFSGFFFTSTKRFSGVKTAFFHYWILTKLIKERRLQMCNLNYVVILTNQGQIQINWYFFPNSEGVLWILYTCNGLIPPICGWEVQMDEQLFSHMLILPHPTQNHSTTLNLSKETYIFPLCTVSVTG